MPTWSFTDVGTLGGGGYQESHAYGLNEAGIGVGESDDPQSKAHACRFAGVPPDDLSPLAEGGRAYGIANGAPERIVGIADKHAMLWQDGASTDLHPHLEAHFGSLGVSEARHVNDTGLVVGHADGHAFTLVLDTQAISEIPLPPGSQGVATAVNATGHVAGTWSDGTTTTGFFYDGVTRIDLVGADDVNDLNDADAVVGSSGFGTAFRWTPTGGMQDLTSVSGLSNASGVNNAGDIVGQIPETADGQPHAALWDGVELVDLNDFGPGGDWILTGGARINDERHIFGNALHKENARAFKLAPAFVAGPLPEDIGLLVAQILFGGTQDGAGFEIVGRHGHPIDPWGPLEGLLPAHREVLVGLAIHKLAGLLSDTRARREVESAGILAIRTGADQLAEGLG